MYVLMKKGIRQYVAIGGIVLLAALAGWFMAVTFHSSKPVANESIPVRENSSEYKFINPLLFTENGTVHSPEHASLEQQVTSYISEAKNKGDAESVSVYFRDLNTGRWTGVNEDEKYKPSSMLKVPLLMADLKLAEKKPEYLSEERPYVRQYDARQYYQPKTQLTNKNYTIEQLLSAMIIDSDNDAANTLFNDNSEGFKELYQAFRLPTPSEDSPDYMSAKSYSVIFRILYNSSYLSRDMSERALKLLSQTDFNMGLTGDLPKTITVSHKFGENTLEFPGGVVQQKEFHDCGIIYYPSNPYLLCVMTRGQDFSKLAAVVSNISKLTYTYIDQKLNQNK